MITLKEKLQEICESLSLLLFQLSSVICVKNFNDLPTQIMDFSQGTNKIPLVINKSIQQIVSDDLKNAIVIPGTVFCNCTSLESVAIPHSVKFIGTGAFFDCTSLEIITIPDSVIQILSGAFQNCISLASVIIPNSVTLISDYAFSGCTGLADIYLNPITPPNLGATNAIPLTATIHVPVGSGEAYRNATNWSYHASRIVEDIEI